MRAIFALCIVIFNANSDTVSYSIIQYHTIQRTKQINVAILYIESPFIKPPQVFPWDSSWNSTFACKALHYKPS